MQFLKRFFYPIALLLIVLLTVLYLNRALFNEKQRTGEVEALAGQVDSVIAKLQESRPSVESEQPSSAAEPPEEEPLAAQQAETEQTPQAATTENAGGDVAPAPASSSNVEAAATAKPADDTETNESTAAASLEDPWHTWQQARAAAWKGDYTTAIELYREVVAQQPDNFDAYGEMGNVMLNSGDREGAAEAYYQAAVLLNQTPYRMMSWQLLNLIAWLAPEKADSLYEALVSQQ